jgi:hypothetical protein
MLAATRHARPAAPATVRRPRVATRAAPAARPAGATAPAAAAQRLVAGAATLSLLLGAAFAPAPALAGAAETLEEKQELVARQRAEAEYQRA